MSRRRSAIKYDNVEDLVKESNKRSRHDDDEGATMTQSSSSTQLFPSQAPDLTQSLPAVKDSEKQNLESLDGSTRSKILRDLTRLVLFKGLAKEPIHRLQILKEAGVAHRVHSAAFEEVGKRLKDCFGFELKRIPEWMDNMKELPQKYKDRYYLANMVAVPKEGDDEKQQELGAKHSKAIHSVHASSAVANGLLLVICCLAYCQGQPRTDGSRWIREADLYSLLHRLDENIPKDPPTVEGASRHRFTNSTEGGTPNVDALLGQFVKQDYLLHKKVANEDASHQPFTIMYSMGPRAAIELGRKQVVYSCASILGVNVEEGMLRELGEEGHSQE